MLKKKKENSYWDLVGSLEVKEIRDNKIVQVYVGQG